MLPLRRLIEKTDLSEEKALAQIPSNTDIEETQGDVESDITMASDELTRSESCLRDQHPQHSPQLNIDIKTLPKEDQANCIQLSLWEEIKARLKNNDNQPLVAKRLSYVENRMSFFSVIGFFLCLMLISISITLAINQSL